MKLSHRFQLAVHAGLGRLGYGITHYRHPLRAPVLSCISDVLARVPTATTPLECAELYQAVRATESVPGDMAEVGVYRGATALVMLAASPARRLHLFDTFTGLPHAEGHLQAGEYSASVEAIRGSLNGSGSRVQFHRGLFPETAAGLEQMTFSFVHLDVDLYDSTLAGLQFFWPRLQVGGMLLSHDYPLLDGVTRAFHEFFPKGNFLALSGHQCLVVKTDSDR